MIHYTHQSARYLTTVFSVLVKVLEHCGPSRRQSCLAGDDEGVEGLLTLGLLQRSATRQNLTSSQFMIKSVEHLQNVGFACVKTEQMWPQWESSYRRPNENFIYFHALANGEYSLSHFTALALILLAVWALLTVLRVAARLQSAEQDFPQRPPWDILKNKRVILRKLSSN